MSRTGIYGKGYNEAQRNQDVDWPPKRKHPAFTKGLTFPEMEAFHYENFDPGDLGPGPGPIDPVEPDPEPECINTIIETHIVTGGDYSRGIVSQLRQALAARCEQIEEDTGEDCCTQLNLIILSCLQLNSLCYCIACSSAGSQINVNCDDLMPVPCQNIVCENPDDPCPPFTLPGGDLMAPVTICPSPIICAASISGGTANADGCIDVPAVGCGTKTVTVTDICGNTKSTEVRMPSGVWVETSNICHSGCGRDCNTYCANTTSCYVISGGTRTYYQYCNLFGQPCEGVNGPCCVSSAMCPGYGSVTLGCDPTYPTGGQFCAHIMRTITYEWRCP